jgi:hypothetical protein
MESIAERLWPGALTEWGWRAERIGKRRKLSCDLPSSTANEVMHHEVNGNLNDISVIVLILDRGKSPTKTKKCSRRGNCWFKMELPSMDVVRILDSSG